MKAQKRRVLLNVILSILLVFTSFFASSCFFDPDKAINLKDDISKKVVVQENSTLFYLYYHSEEHPIDDYDLIKVTIEYYVDYKTSMKKKDFFISIPDDVKYEEGQPYFTAEIKDALTEQSVVFISTHANYKRENTKEDNSRVWEYILSIVIALVLLIIFWVGYSLLCEAFDSNTLWPSVGWLGGLVIYIIIAIIIWLNWGTGPASMILWGAILYFICTLYPFFKYKQ